MDTVEYIVDRYRLTLNRRGRPTEIPDMSRDDLPGLFNELGFTTGAEIGVEQGVYSEVLCRGLPDARLYLVDAWTAYRGYRDHVTQDKMDRFYATTMERLAPYDNFKVVRDFSMEAIKHFEDGSLDFVYIDGNHMIPWVIDDICAWRKKVRPGGIVAGHDYYRSKRKHTTNHSVYAVHCAVESWRIDPWFLVGTKDELPGMKRDHSRSWFWVRE